MSGLNDLLGLLFRLSLPGLIAVGLLFSIRSKTLSRTGVRFAACGAGIIVLGYAAWIAAEIWNPYPESLLERVFLRKPHYFQIDISLMVDGEAVHINRKITCYHFSDGKVMASIPSFGRQLKSGGAILVATPPVCNNWELWQKEKWNETDELLDRPLIPLIGWLDSVTNPTVGELYQYTDYYVRPDARVKIQSFSMHRISHWILTDQPDDFAMFFGASSWHFRERNISLNERHIGMVAYAIQSIDEDVWSGYDFKDQLADVRMLQFLTPQINNRQGPLSREFDSFDRWGCGSVARPMNTPLRKARRSPRPDGKYPTIFRVVRSRDTYKIGPPFGSVIYFHPTTPAYFRQATPDDRNRACPRLVIDGREAECSLKHRGQSHLIYDPQTRILYSFGGYSMNWPLPAQ